MITKKKLGRGLSNLIPAEMATATIEEVIKSSGQLEIGRASCRERV